MKRLVFIILLITLSLKVYGQSEADIIVNKVLELRSTQNDSIARDYLTLNKEIFVNNNASPTFILLWGQLTSNMWNANPHPALTQEYKEYLDFIFSDESFHEESYDPGKELLDSFWRLSYDYINILFKDNEYEKALEQAELLHHVFRNYPTERYLIGYAQSLHDHCYLLVSFLHKYQEGLPYLEEYVDVAKNVYGEHSKEYAASLYDQGSCHQSLNQIDEARELFIKSRDILNNLDESDNELLQKVQQSLAMNDVLRTGKVENNISYTNLDNLSIEEITSLVVSGRGTEALQSLLKMKDSISSDLRVDTLRLSSIENLIAKIYTESGNYSLAQNELDSFNKQYTIEKLPDEFIPPFYSLYGNISHGLKEYDNAYNYFKKEINKLDIIGDFGINYIMALSNTALVLFEKEDYLGAKWYIDEAISIYEERIGNIFEGGNLGLTLLNNRVMMYVAIGDKAESLEVYQQIVDNYRNNPMYEDSWLYAVNNLAVLYYQEGRFDDAISLLEGIKSNNSELQNMIEQNLLLAYYLSGNSNIREQLIKNNEICRNNCLNVFEYFSESERESYWIYNARTLMVNNTIAENNPGVADIAYDNVLFTKGLTLTSSDVIKQYVQSENNIELTQLYKRVEKLRQNLNYNRNNVDSISNWNNELKEKEHLLVQSIPNLKGRLITSFNNWEDVKNNLREDELAIEFIFIPRLIDNVWDTSDIYYGALVLSHSDELPRIINFGKDVYIERLVEQITSDPITISNIYNKTDEGSIYDKIWSVLEPYMKGKKTIYFSPTGVLNSLNHGAIMTNDGIRMSEKYNLVRVSTTGKIPELKHSEDRSYLSATIYGGINYDEDVAEMKRMAQNYVPINETSEFLALRAEDERGKWNLLLGTKKEADDINDILKSNNLNTTLYEWNEANEESFKGMDEASPSIIHLSTHGFFLDTYDKIVSNPFMQTVGSYSGENDILTRSGLLLAGANNVWTGKAVVVGAEDGILTADEISRLDLRNTGLVVLSACETGRGYNDEIEGVLGLQRAFKKAGAGTIVMSLWKVPDIATSILMTSFYENLMQGNNPRNALLKAQQYLMEQDANYKNPYYWAAFIVLD